MITKVNLGLSRLSVLELLGFAFQVIAKMTGNGYFPSPHPSLGTVSSAASNLLTAFEAAEGGGILQTKTMNRMRAILENRLTELGHYVEDVANDLANISIGPAEIISSAGMNPRKFTPRQKNVFAVKHGKLPGVVILSAAGIRRGVHEWQYTLDPSSEANWVSVNDTTKASVIISGLTSGVRFYFRHRAILKDGPTEWDGLVTIIVL